MTANDRAIGTHENKMLLLAVSIVVLLKRRAGIAVPSGKYCFAVATSGKYFFAQVSPSQEKILLFQSEQEYLRKYHRHNRKSARNFGTWRLEWILDSGLINLTVVRWLCLEHWGR